MKNVLIIGAGFSGTAVAAQLLRRGLPDGLRVIVVNRSGSMARGIAYGTQSADHLLNVPAGNMSALADEPDHFVNFCRRIDPAVTATTFVPRRVYGEYLEHLLIQAAHAHPKRASLLTVIGEVTRIVTRREGAYALLADGRKLEADAVVLAFGHYPPKDPPIADPSFYGSSRYVRDPWARNALQAVGPGQPVLLLGTGLTAADVASNLLKAGPARPLFAVSRRGLLPQPHRASLPGIPRGNLPVFSEEDTASVRALLRLLRRHIRDLAQSGGDWREVIASLRPITQGLWQGLPAAEKQRFLRHVQPFWDVHRHRIAPAPHAEFQSGMQTGALKIMAGRVVSYEEDDAGVRVTIRQRGGEDVSTLHVGHVVNCTGPSTDLRRVDDALVRQLVDEGLIVADPLGLGLSVAENCAVVDAQGRHADAIFYIGPMLRAHYWEATAVPELRVFAKRLASTILERWATSDRETSVD